MHPIGCIIAPLSLTRDLNGLPLKEKIGFEKSLEKIPGLPANVSAVLEDLDCFLVPGVLQKSNQDHLHLVVCEVVRREIFLEQPAMITKPFGQGILRETAFHALDDPEVLFINL